MLGLLGSTRQAGHEEVTKRYSSEREGGSLGTCKKASREAAWAPKRRQGSGLSSVTFHSSSHCCTSKSLCSQSAAETMFLEGALCVLRDVQPEFWAVPEFTPFCDTVLQ